MKKLIVLIVLAFTSLNYVYAKEIFKVIATDLNVRSGAGSYYSVTGKVHYGDEVELIEKSNENWYYIRFSSIPDNGINKTGYVYSKYLKSYRSSKGSLPNSNGLVINQEKRDKAMTFLIGLLVIIGIAFLIYLFDSKGEKPKSKINLETKEPHRTVVITTKSTGVAILLVFISGPLGLFYSTVLGGIIMTFVVPICSFVFFFPFLLESDSFLFLFAGGWILVIPLYWFICLIWTVNAVSSYNKRLLNTYQ